VGRPLACATALLAAAAIAAAPATAKTKTKTFQNPTPVPIPQAIDNPSPTPDTYGEAVSDVPVTKKGTVKDVNVGVQITHPDTRDLLVYLFKGERYIELAALNSGFSGSSEANYGGGIACAGGITVFDDLAPTFIYGADNPFAGSYRPAVGRAFGGAGSLAEFNGEKLNGTWRLLVLSNDPPPPIATGTIQCVQIIAKYKVAKQR
jgi:hypothetical protein